MHARLKRTIFGAVLAACAFAACTASAYTIPPPPNPGFEASVHAADVIAEVEVLAGGPFRSVVAVRRLIRGSAPAVCELAGYNSFNLDTVNTGFATGARYILFLSKTGNPETLTPLTPTAPRLHVNESGAMLSLGDPPFTFPVPVAALDETFRLMLAYAEDGKTPPNAAETIARFLKTGALEQRYLAVALAGYVRDEASLPAVVEATRDRLLRLRLTALESLRKLGTSDARAALRGLLRDRSATVEREAAAALLDLQDLSALEELLAWAKRAAGKQAELAEGDARRAKTQQVLMQLFDLLQKRGALLPADKLCPLLLDLTRNEDRPTAAAAVQALGTLAGPAQVASLMDLADDPLYAQRMDAAYALFRLTLHSASDMEEFRTWWRGFRPKFGEAYRRETVEAAANGLLARPDFDARDRLVGLLRAAPAGIALVCAAPLLSDPAQSVSFQTSDLGAWSSPLALPFLLERLGASDAMDRRTALELLAALAKRHSRLRPVVLPFVRASLGDSYGGQRRTACAAAGTFDMVRELPALIDALRARASYESAEASGAVYALSSRTLGYGRYEGEDQIDAAIASMTGWWNNLAAPGQPDAKYPLRASAQDVPWRVPFRMQEARPVPVILDAAALEGLLTGEETAKADAAFAVLYADRRSDDELWAKLLDAKRLRDRAYGVAGLLGADVPAVRLAALLPKAGQAAPLESALAFSVLGALPKGAGAASIVEWLDGPGGSSGAIWRRMAILSLGLADGEARSRDWLAAKLKEAVANEDALFAGDAALTGFATLVALCARSDSDAALVPALAARTQALRETALRTLVLRRYAAARKEIFGALAAADSYDIDELLRQVAPLFSKDDAPLLETALSDGTAGGRMAAVGLLSLRPELAATLKVREGLLLAARDDTGLTRVYTARAMGRIPERAYVAALLEMLQDARSSVRTAAAGAIGRLGEPAACRDVAMEARMMMRLSPEWLPALGRHGDDPELELLLKYSKSDVVQNRTVSIEALGYCCRDGAQARLLELLRDAESPHQTGAADALAVQGEYAVPALAKELASAEVKDRARALLVLSRMHNGKAAQALLEALNDTDAGLRALADFGLRRVTGKRADFDAAAGEAERKAGIDRWRALLAAPQSR
ncbi:MAG: HEAT repeat domain-containing protein [Planctomycetes bacterium]|nr:HEAT repeat domain-containing protein [Planctomycetota bacterium]